MGLAGEVCGLGWELTVPQGACRDDLVGRPGLDVREPSSGTERGASGGRFVSPDDALAETTTWTVTPTVSSVSGKAGRGAGFIGLTVSNSCEERGPQEYSILGVSQGRREESEDRLILPIHELGRTDDVGVLIGMLSDFES